MKTLKCKPTLEVLEDRLALSGSPPGPAERLLVGNESADVLTYIEQDNLYKFRESMNFVMCDGSVRLKAGLVGSAEYLRGGSSFMIGEDIPDADARFQKTPPSILIGLLLP